MYVHALGDFVHSVDQSLPDLKDLVSDAVGQSVRRISRFMQLALLGAGRCARDRRLPASTAVYLASSRGDLEISIDVMNHVFRNGQAPKPLSFVNTVSNSAAFYVAKCLDLNARSTFVSSRYFAFEDALQLAIADFELHVVDSALVGTVDNAVLPLSAHRERLELPTTTPIAEASHWLWLTRESAGALARVASVQSVADESELIEWLVAQRFDRQTQLSGGQFLSDSQLAKMAQGVGLAIGFDYRRNRDYYPSQSAAAIGAWLAEPKTVSSAANRLVHVNGDAIGRYVAFVIEAIPPSAVHGS